MSTGPRLYLGASLALDGTGTPQKVLMPANHLVTHGVVVGMTGSGKTGLVVVAVEEALCANVPVLMIDVKGDLPNLLLNFPSFDPAHLVPWVEGAGASADGKTAEQIAAQLAGERHAALGEWGIGETDLAEFCSNIDVRVITPGSTAGEQLHVLSSLERRSPRWDTDREAAEASLAAAISLVMRLLGRDADPARSREHILLSVLAERRLLAGGTADLPALLHDLVEPPIAEIGALAIDDFMPKADRKSLAAALNGLLASPTFSTWRTGATLDIESWFTPKAPHRTPAVIVSVAHLDDEERALVLGVLLEELLAWVRSLPGSERLRALVVFDEVYGFLPPHPANPPTKRPLVALMKQARAFGVGVIVATQNPMDLDYRALGNAGVWCIGRLQTDADRARVIDSLAGSIGQSRAATRALDGTVQRLEPRWFVLRDAHDHDGPKLMQPRYAMSFLRGPMTRVEIERARRGAHA